VKLSDLKPGDKFRLWSMPETIFSLINPRFGIFQIGRTAKIKYTYVSLFSHQLYGSYYDYKVIKVEGDEIQKLVFGEDEVYAG
jgi:hypothetical protein